ncbi:hypothetical protein OG481_01975 [Streptomyces longwoodensis]|uniref:hypothetical protein n=1 Tax=Streptomyces longwoodensis TaxID=68231 RepID=UPI002DDC722D|nr:hypothetical protein [Streptomyces longwoodensis]WRY87360.1 hypothetical protein OG481_01975 [Streptomyces longwoodensis]
MQQHLPLPHDPYITAVVRALLFAGMEPDGWWTSDAETDPYATGDDAGCATMLNAVLNWGPNQPTLNTDVHPDGITLIWEHPAEQWQWAPRKQHGELEREPDFLPNLGRWSDPAAVVATVRALLAGEPLPEGHAPYWHPADSVRRAVDAWAAAQTED